MRVFDDLYSWLHMLYAFLLAVLDPVLAVAASIVFYGYQRYERERWERKRGDFVEWMVGLLLGALVRAIVVTSGG